MKKYICLGLMFAFLTTLSVSACHFKFWGKGINNTDKSSLQIKTQPTVQAKELEIVPTIDTLSNAVNQVWVGTFQLVWNDLMDEIVKQPIEFIGYKSLTAERLNAKTFSVNELSESAYYKKWGLVSSDLKREIEHGIKEKFNETSDILGGLDWTPAPRKYLLYAMLKKDFEYLKPFDKLADSWFAGSEGSVKYFGVDEDTKYDVRNTVRVLFYNNANDYAVSLESKQGDIVYLYRTDDDRTLGEYYKDLNSKKDDFKGNTSLKSIDKFKAPMIDFYSETSFPELCGKAIKNTDFMIAQAIETVKFKMDETGVKLKSEAVIVTKATCCLGQVEQPRYFYFNNKYVIFLKEKDKEPYFAMKVADAKKLQKSEN